MKGSPILATALACIIMLSMYVGMRLVFSQDRTSNKSTSSPITGNSHDQEIKSLRAYADIYFSIKPQSIRISHPASGKKLLDLADLEDFEWSGEIQLPISSTEELELLCEVDWASATNGYQFIQLILSPDGHEDQSQTLRSEANIADIMNFHWKEAAHE